MTRTVYPLAIPDVAAFARSLGTALKERHPLKPEPPSHVELLNLIARAVGLRNMQALREHALRQVPPPPPADTAKAPGAEDPPAAATTAPLSDNARKALHQFDGQGRLMRWPVKYSVQKLVMWVLWTQFDAKRVYTESEVNAVLKRAHLFFDHATLRRELINHRLMERKSDCSEYRKLPARPDDETRALLGAWRARSRG